MCLFCISHSHPQPDFYTTQKLIGTNEKTEPSFLLPGSNKVVIPRELFDPCIKYFSLSGFINSFKNIWPTDKTYDEQLEIYGPSLCTASNDPKLPLLVDHVGTH